MDPGDNFTSPVSSISPVGSPSISDAMTLQKFFLVTQYGHMLAPPIISWNILSLNKGREWRLGHLVR